MAFYPLKSISLVVITLLSQPCAISVRYPSSDTVYRRVVENAKLTQKVRLAALSAMSRPSLWFLMRLLKNPETPSRLHALAAKRYEKEILRRNLRYANRSRNTAKTDNQGPE